MVDDVQQEFSIGQLLNCLTEKRLWLLEWKPNRCMKAGEMLDTYEQARRKEGGLAKQRQGVKAVETLHESEKAPRDTPVRMPEQRSSSRGPRCYSCHQFGHVSSKGSSQGSYYGGCFRNCGKFQKTENGDTLVPVRSGKVEGTDVSDTGGARNNGKLQIFIACFWSHNSIDKANAVQLLHNRVALQNKFKNAQTILSNYAIPQAVS